MNKLILKLSKMESIKITPDNNIDFEKIDFCCGNLKVYFVDEQVLRIGQESAGLVFEAFIGNLKKAIEGKLQIHESITKKLGIMWNDKFQGETGFVMVPTLSGKGAYWVGLNYEVWETFNDANPYVNTWLYNDYEGNIVLEVTKFYKWSMQEREPENPEFVTYEEFMKDYKPLIRRVIPRDIAIAWLDQSMKVYRGFFSSEEHYQRACKELNW